jgi:tRNA A37 N6-isopentenylltransferase MiaA
VKLRTRQFAKRQLTFFRRQFQAQWLELAPDETSAQTAERLLALVGEPRSESRL